MSSTQQMPTGASELQLKGRNEKQDPESKRTSDTSSVDPLMLLSMQENASHWEYFMNELEFE